MIFTEEKKEQATGLRITHRLLHTYYGVSSTSTLNWPAEEPERQLNNFAPNDLFRITKVLEGEAIHTGGREVDYSLLRSSSTYGEFKEAAIQLHYFDPLTLKDQNQRLAFWINLYNALTLDAVIQLDVRNSVQEVRGFFWKAAYSVGGWRISAHDIEHGVLRANSAHPAIPGSHFGLHDARRAFSLAKLDPRIHFALNCASKSCPPISVYTSQVIDDQLELSAMSFINHGGIEVDINKGEVRLSKIFQWYSSDFGGRLLALGDKRPLMTFIAPYVTNENHRQFLLEGSPKIKFLPYDWDLNQLKDV